MAIFHRQGNSLPFIRSFANEVLLCILVREIIIKIITHLLLFQLLLKRHQEACHSRPLLWQIL